MMQEPAPATTTQMQQYHCPPRLLPCSLLEQLEETVSDAADHWRRENCKDSAVFATALRRSDKFVSLNNSFLSVLFR